MDNITDMRQYGYNGNATDMEPAPPGMAEQIGNFLVQFYTPVLVYMGSLGNILSVCVFFRTKLRKLSSSYYLAALAISDTLFLMALFVGWLTFVDIDVSNRNGFCQLLVYMSGVCSFLSVWFVVAFTVERFVAVMYPLKRQSMCTVSRAKGVLTGLTVLSLAHSAPLLVFSSPQYNKRLNHTICDVTDSFKEAAGVFNTIDTVVSFIVPLTAIVMLNSCTAYTVWKLAGVRRSMTVSGRNCIGTYGYGRCVSQCTTPTGGGGTTTCSSHGTSTNMLAPPRQCTNHQRARLNNNSQIKVTKMLLIVSTVFVCLNLPSYVMRVRAFIESTDADKDDKTTVIVQYYCWLFFNTNFGINFVLYCVSGQNFRRAVVTMFCPRPRRRQDGTQVTVSEYLRSSGSNASRRRTTVTQNGSWRDLHELHTLQLQPLP